MDLIPNSGMAVINDVGNLANIHPQNKAPVGERLARWALHGTYGKKALVHSGPIVKEVTRAGGQLRITFDSIGSGLASRDGQALTWFEVAGADQIYVKGAPSRLPQVTSEQSAAIVLIQQATVKGC
jgi:sialate O-acetylesterase